MAEAPAPAEPTATQAAETVSQRFAYMLSLGSFRGGPSFPALYLAAAGAIMAPRLPGFTLTPAVGVGMGAAIVAILRLPLAAVGSPRCSPPIPEPATSR